MRMATNDSRPQRLPYQFAKRFQVLIGNSQGPSLEILYTQMPKPETIIELRRFLAQSLCLTQVNAATFTEKMTQTYESSSGATSEMITTLEEEVDLTQLVDGIVQVADLLETQDDAPIIRLLNTLFTQAIKQEASDLHFETFEENLRVRFRIDGILHQVLDVQRNFAPLVMSRIKVMAKLDIAEKRLPQDGRISLRIAGRAVDVRVSTIPSNHGERVVLRLLDKQATTLDLRRLGMDADSLALLETLIHQPHGIVLVTGPTGSGKSTTLYAGLTKLNTTSRNILTVEDPIEYDLAGIGQMQVNAKIDMTFAKGLRAILRQDPDVVMVGEIRDRETAEISIQASLTGHLVLSTLHTNTALGAISRMRDLGVESFLLSSSLIGLLAQRLVRTLCQACKVAITITPTQRKWLEISHNKPTQIYQANGCEQCSQLGYKGRIGIYELIAIDKKLQGMISSQASEQDIETYAHENYRSIKQDGCQKILAGLTTLEEVLRVISSR